MKYFTIFPFILGAIAGATLGMTLTHYTPLGHSDGSHPIGYADSAEKVHVHSDFILYLDGVEYDLSDDKYQSKTGHVLGEHIHLHDNNDEIIHRHDHGVTLGSFFDSLGFSLTDNCIETEEGDTFCSEAERELIVFVNDVRIESPSTYVNQEEDRILVYYGDTGASSTITDLLLRITDKACIYSGTCPERGVAPAESCGLTCEL